MDIHPPEGPIRSLRDFLLHLFMITLAVLIALGAEGLVQHFHDRNVVREANQNLQAEMADNLQTLNDNLPKLEHNQELLVETLADLKKLESDRHAKTRDINLNLNFFSLTDNSWRTAQATGALALMPYKQVQDYAGYYDVQSMLNRLSDGLEDSWLDMSASFNPLGDDPSKMDDRQLAEIERNVQLSLGKLIAVENIAKSLKQQYENKLNGKAHE